jgi:hypothetical protein
LRRRAINYAASGNSILRRHAFFAIFTSIKKVPLVSSVHFAQ